MTNPSEESKRVLIGIPYHPSKPWCLELALAAATHIAQETRSATVDIFLRTDPSEVYGGKDNVKRQRSAIRKVAIQGNYEYLFFMGMDTVPPGDVIDRLMGHGEAVASGVYWHKPQAGRTELEAVAWRRDLKGENKRKVMAGEFAESLWCVDGFGLDCALIRRDALKRLDWTDWEVNDDDWPWCDAMRKLGVSLYVDTSVQCRHYEDRHTYSFKGDTVAEG